MTQLRIEVIDREYAAILVAKTPAERVAMAYAAYSCCLQHDSVPGHAALPRLDRRTATPRIPPGDYWAMRVKEYLASLDLGPKWDAPHRLEPGAGGPFCFTSITLFGREGAGATNEVVGVRGVHR